MASIPVMSTPLFRRPWAEQTQLTSCVQGAADRLVLPCGMERDLVFVSVAIVLHNTVQSAIKDSEELSADFKVAANRRRSRWEFLMRPPSVVGDLRGNRRSLSGPGQIGRLTD
jgi:hypothetical protein